MSILCYSRDLYMVLLTVHLNSINAALREFPKPYEGITSVVVRSSSLYIFKIQDFLLMIDCKPPSLEYSSIILAPT